jgi:hypothetical protein
VVVQQNNDSYYSGTKKLVLELLESASVSLSKSLISYRNIIKGCEVSGQDNDGSSMDFWKV